MPTSASSADDTGTNKAFFHKRNSFHELPELDSPNPYQEVCLKQHVLHKCESDIDGLHCDMCGGHVKKGAIFWGCRICCWDKCSKCYEDGIDVQKGQHVEVVMEFLSEGSEGSAGSSLKSQRIKRSTTGRVETKNDEAGYADIKFDHHLFLTDTARVNKQHFHCLKCSEEPKGNVKIIIGVTVICVLFIAGILNEKWVSLMLERFINWCRTLGLWACVFIALLCTLLPVIMMPVFPMMALSGPLFTAMYHGDALVGGAIAFGCVFTGLWLGSVIAFALGKSLFKDFAEKAGAENQYLKRINKIIDRGGVKIVLMARSLPILPAEVFDYAATLTSLNTWQYAIGCFGSAVPVAFWTFSSAQAAAGAEDAAKGKGAGKGGQRVLLIVINVVALIVLTAGLAYTIKTHEEQDPTEIPEAVITTSTPARKLKRGMSHLSRTLSSLSEPVQGPGSPAAE